MPQKCRVVKFCWLHECFWIIDEWVEVFLGKTKKRCYGYNQYWITTNFKILTCTKSNILISNCCVLGPIFHDIWHLVVNLPDVRCSGFIQGECRYSQHNCLKRSQIQNVLRPVIILDNPSFKWVPGLTLFAKKGTTATPLPLYPCLVPRACLSFCLVMCPPTTRAPCLGMNGGVQGSA